MSKIPNEHSAAFAANQRLWDIRTCAHLEPGVYGIEDTLAGMVTLSPLEVDEVGPVAGKDLLHLQCHFGMGTISWSRLGAHATGLDFSPEAVSAARKLAEDCRVAAEFVQANVYDLPEALPRQFDVVFTSYGVLWWLPDLLAWADIIWAMLRPGGVFYIAEIHPFAQTLAMEGEAVRVAHDYFGTRAPITFESSGTYAHPDIRLDSATEHGWQHGLGEVVSALLGVGLQIEYLKEHPFSCYRMLPSFERGADGYWHPPSGTPTMPLLFSLRARKPT